MGERGKVAGRILREWQEDKKLIRGRTKGRLLAASEFSAEGKGSYGEHECTGAAGFPKAGSGFSGIAGVK